MLTSFGRHLSKFHSFCRLSSCQSSNIFNYCYDTSIYSRASETLKTLATTKYNNNNSYQLELAEPSHRPFCSHAGPIKHNIMKVLNVAEKNDAAKNISNIISRGTAQRREGYSKYNKVYDFQANIPALGGQCDMTMTSVSGHLMEFGFGEQYKGWHQSDPKELFDAIIQETIGDNSGKQIKRTLEREVKNCQALIIWTDGDREGENIGFQIIRVCLNVKRNLNVLRARFSEITPRAMNIALGALVPPDANVSKAVDTRKELDLRFGCVFTRFQTIELQRSFANIIGKEVISYGPCQFPTIGFVISRYKEILNFRPQDFWYLDLKYTRDNTQMIFNWKRVRLFDENSCLALYYRLMDNPRALVTQVKGKQKLNYRPQPMYTTSMEKLASTKLRMTAKKAMDVAEKLYNKGIISYPRTETNIFPKGMNLVPLVQNQTPHPEWGTFAQRILDNGGPYPRQGKKTDNAHPPIHPTRLARDEELNAEERNLYHLVTRHFLACVSKDAVGFETDVEIDVSSEKFNCKGLIIQERNYLDVYPYFKWNAKEIARFQIGEQFLPDSIMMLDGKTTHPMPLTESELISLMEKHGIGTDATHADLIDKVQKRNYVKKMRNMYFVPCKIGLALYDGYDEMRLKHLTRPQLRSQLESDLQAICEQREDARRVANKYIIEHKQIYDIVTRDKQKLMNVFSTTIHMEEPEKMIQEILRRA